MSKSKKNKVKTPSKQVTKMNLPELNSNVLPKLVKKLLGPQAEDLKEHVRDENGLVPLNRLMDEIEEIFNSKTWLKN